MHIFKPGDMAKCIVCAVAPEVVGMLCIVESHPRKQTMRRPDSSTYVIDIVDITIGHPQIVKANVDCLKYIPPDEWPIIFKERQLVPIDVTPDLVGEEA